MSRPDTDVNLNRLSITMAQRDELIRSLQMDFGRKLDQENKNFIVKSAALLRDNLSKKGYKCSDEPVTRYLVPA